jgi:hypothetical protein
MTRLAPGLSRSLAALWLFGVAFGFVEAAVVVYLRALYAPIHQKLYPDREPGDLFPLLRLDQLEAEGEAARGHVEIELVREACTIVMLAAVGLAAGRTARESFAAFLVAFGIWDIFFYIFLKVLVDWPSSLGTWDVLFLLPVPWSAPVIAPVIVAASMIGTGTFVLAREAADHPIRLSRLDWGLVIAGGLVIVVAFCWDFRNIMAGGRPNPFHWRLFALGEAIGLAGFFQGARKSLNSETEI